MIDHSDKYVPEPNTGCWLWTGACNSAGRPSLRIDGRTVTAARIFALCDDPSMDVHHTCKTIACVNPQHLVVMPWKKHKRLARTRWGKLGQLSEEQRQNIYNEMHAGVGMNEASRKHGIPVVELHRLYHQYWQHNWNKAGKDKDGNVTNPRGLVDSEKWVA